MSILHFLKKVWIWVDVKLIKPHFDKKIWKFENWPIDKHRAYYNLNKRDLNKFYPAVCSDVPFKNQNIYGKHLIDIHTEYLYIFTFPCILEPECFLLINKLSGKLIERSRPNQFDPWGADMSKVPSLIKYYLHPNRQKLERAVVINQSLWFNYYHFFFDVLTQIVKLNQLGIDKNIPIIVPERLKQTSFINDFKKISTLLQERNLVYVKPSDYVEITKEAIVVRDSSIHHETICEILNTIDTSSIHVTNNNILEYVFISRNANSKRALKNTREIETIAQKNGFTIVDTADWNLIDQITFFRQVKNIVGIHGAGLTNIIFSQHSSLKLLEIMPEDLDAAFYEHICLNFSYSYKRIKGNKREAKEQFFLDPEKFENTLQNFFFDKPSLS